MLRTRTATMLMAGVIGSIIGLMAAVIVAQDAKIDYLKSKELPEYELKLINQDSVKLHSNESGKTYLITPEEIVQTLEQDNM